MNKNKSRKLRLGDLVRIKNQNHTLGIVTQECYLEQDIMHPFQDVAIALAVKVQWIDNSRGPAIGAWTTIYYEKALELLQSGPA